MAAKIKPMRVVPPPPPPPCRDPCPPEAKRKKGCPLKTKAKPPAQARPVEPVKDHERDEDDVQGGEDQGKAWAEESGRPSTADTGSTMDAAESDAMDDKDVKGEVDMKDVEGNAVERGRHEGDMKAALYRAMARQEIKENLQQRIKENYAPLFKAKVAPRILHGLIPFEHGQE